MVAVVAVFGLGFFPGYAIHMCFDLFPKKWQGGALIKSPLGAFPMAGSFIWMLCGQIVANYLALRLVRTPVEALILIVASAFLFRFYRKKEDTRWRPVAMMVGVLVFLFWVDPPLWWEPIFKTFILR